MSKRCSKCGVEKPLTEFHRGARYKDGHRGACKACAHRKANEWQRNNPEWARSIRARYWEAHREEWSARRRKRPADWQPMTKAEIAKRWYMNHKAQHLAEARERYRLHPERRKAIKYRRRARMHSAPGHATPEQIRERVEVYGGKCWICGAEYQEIDHVIPLSRGGSNWPANLRPICKSCNSRKQDRAWTLYLR